MRHPSADVFMAEQNQSSQEEAPPKTVTSFLDVAWSVVTPRLYQDNPFRVLGLHPLAGGREVMKRADQLKLGEELGTASYDWSFAPNPPPSPDHLRNAVQALKEPQQRLIAELFWFWPNSYPVEGEDKALEHLNRGETAEAVAEWAAMPSAENPAALHNLAVYHHLMAIEQEQAQPPLAPDDVAAWWRAALRYWQVVVETDEIWQRMELRVQTIDDAQLPVDVVAPLRRVLLELISAVNSALALRSAESQDEAAAARQIAVLGELHTEGGDVRRVLERGVAPITRRIDAQIVECQRAVTEDAAKGLGAARYLVEHCASDIQILNTLCGNETEFYAEVCTRLAVATLDAVVSFQHGSSDNVGCLPVLIYLQTLPLMPEAARRLHNTFEVIYANAAATQEEKHEGSELDEGREPLYARSYRIVADHLIRAVEQMNFNAAIERECDDRLADLLRRVAKGATDERDDINFALHAYKTLLQLPCDPRERARREAERDQFHQQFLLRLQKELRLELPEHALEITVRGLRWDDQNFTFDAITGIRHGRTPEKEKAVVGENMIIAWRTAETEVVLDASNVFRDPETAEDLFNRIVDAIYFFVVPPLIDRLVQAIQDGETIELGKSLMNKAGIAITTGTRFWRKEEEIPYTEIMHRLQDGAWIVTSVENPRLEVRYSILDVWNAGIMGYVVAALTRT